MGALTDKGPASVSKGQLTIKQVGAAPVHVPSAWHALVLDPDIVYPVTQVYVASLLYERVGVLTTSGITADKEGHVTIEHAGSEPLHEPSAWHVLVSAPDMVYPVSQEYVTSLL